MKHTMLRVVHPFQIILNVMRGYAHVDRYVAPILLLGLILFGPLIPRNTDNPQLLAAFVNDEPWMAQALDGMTTWPLGNPSNYLDPAAKAYYHIPPYWGTLRYPNIVYYGAVMFDIAFPFYATARAMGLPSFPTAPIILRAISLLAALMSLLFVYNFGREQSGVFVGFLSCIVLLTNNDFIYYTTISHPDTLQIYFGLLALGIALRHSNDGLLASLAALGLVCGVVQGTKLGGPWTIPMSATALLFGIRAAGGDIWSKKTIAYRLAILAGAALVGWIGTNPYAVITAYYFNSLVTTWQVVGSSGPFGTTSFSDWEAAIYAYLGPIGSALAFVGLFHGFLGNASSPHRRPQLLAAILSLSLVAYYALLSKFWIVLGYLLLALPLMAILTLDFLGVWLQFVLSRMFGRSAKRNAMIFVGLATLYLCINPVLELIDEALELHLRNSTLLALNDWAKQDGIPPNARVVFDDLAYLDPKLFKNARMYGGVLTWSAVNSLDPEYIILSSSLYGSPHYAKLISTQRLSSDDPNPFSMLLYQSLLPTSTPGATKVEGISFVKEIAPHLTSTDATTGPTHTSWWSRAKIRVPNSIAILQEIWHPPENPTTGPSLRVYKRNPNRPPEDHF